MEASINTHPLIGFSCSLLLHAFIAVALLLIVAATPLTPSIEARIEVEIVSDLPKAFAVPQQAPTSLPANAGTPATPDSTMPTPHVAPAPLPSAPVPQANTKDMIRATHMLAQAVLDDPRSQKAKKKLAQLAGDAKIVQLCSLEAMAQVAAWNESFRPDLIVVYAMGDTTFIDNSLIADGAALHSKQQWFGMRFKCELSPDRTEVIGFEFLMGDLVPRNAWERHNLPAQSGDLE